jgi:hypothetical protein
LEILLGERRVVNAVFMSIARALDASKSWFGLVLLIYLIVALIFRSKRPKLPVWSIMAFASFTSIAFGLLNVDKVVEAIDLDVILFLIVCLVL